MNRLTYLPVELTVEKTPDLPYIGLVAYPSVAVPRSAIKWKNTFFVKYRKKKKNSKNATEYMPESISKYN